MRFLYLDSCAAMKLFLDEECSVELEDWIAGHAGGVKSRHTSLGPKCAEGFMPRVRSRRPARKPSIGSNEPR